jgi:RNA polymerase-binding transcription factor DksA
VTDSQAPPPEPAATDRPDEPALDLERVAADLDGVEAALTRLDDGTYWTDEITGERIPDDVLAANPVTRRTEVGE